ncbi:MAG: response regulator, partial [Desulfobacteraceae bacterium]|nr:response regulator [Desulfobacteraceae bacterium]
MKGRILVVDDKPEMLLLLKRLITEETPHEVVAEAGAAKALTRLREKVFDLLITDLKMP